MSQIISTYYTSSNNFIYKGFGDELDIAIMKRTFYLDTVSHNLMEFFKYIISNNPELMLKYQEDLRNNGPGNGKMYPIG